ncbi:alpha/beta fold hydrolase [Kiloniella sp. b19]|uniref:alpha/beta fold hydrolase n=1 Tax=Kiloniella sp. GXU_MW_B19 TaxID=3141326 RepID=UPI0031CEFE44
MKILCISGWSLGEALWEPFIRQLNPEWEVSCFAPSEQDDPVDDLGVLLLMGGFDAVVAHSWGGALALKLYSGLQLEEGPPLLLCNSFTCFARKADLAEGVEPRVIRRMIRGLDADPQKLLGDFQKQAGLETVDRALMADPVERDRLVQGLNAMLEDDLRKHWSLQKDRQAVAVLASDNDLIVPKALTEACFEGETLQWIKGGGHLLPLSNPQGCAEALLSLL